MKKTFATIIGLLGITGLAYASNNFSYTATGTPGSLPDGVVQNNSPVSVWTLAQNPGVTGGGISGAYYGTAFGGETLSGWQIWSSPGSLATGDDGFIEASNIFAGAGLDSWSGTFNGSLLGIDVFNYGAGNGSDLAFNNLTVATPEAGTFSLFALGGAVLLMGWHLRQNAVRA